MPRHLRMLVLGLLAAPGWGAPPARERLAAFQAEAAAERARQGLERDAARLEALYPAPEVRLPAGAEPAPACPGQTVAVKLEGRFLPGTLVVLQGDEAEVLKESLTPATWEAEVRVLSTAPPGDVLARVLSPVSEAERAVRVLDVGCRHRWRLELPGGEVLTVTTSWPPGANTGTQASGEWTRGGRAQRVALTVRGGGAYTFERVASAAELKARATLTGSPTWRALQLRAEEAQARVNGCARGAAGTQQGCLRSAGEALGKVGQERLALEERALAGLGPTLGCELVRVRAAGGRLSGEAERCLRPPGRFPVTGTLGVPPPGGD